MMLKKYVRYALEELYGAATIWQKIAVVRGVKIPVSGLSSRMRFQLLIGYEQQEAYFAEKYLTSFDRVLEVGASIGFLGTFCSKTIPIKNYAMVEANPSLRSRLEAMFALNDLPAPLLYNCAIGPENGEVTFGLNRYDFSSSTIPRPNEVERVTVSQRSIATILDDLDFVPNTLLMDIEGGEVNIPPSHFRPFQKVIIELHPHIVGSEPINDLLAGLRDAGFQEVERRGVVVYLQQNEAD